MENQLSPELKAFYDTVLLENARSEYFYAQFAKRLPLPLHRASAAEKSFYDMKQKFNNAERHDDNR